MPLYPYVQIFGILSGIVFVIVFGYNAVIICLWCVYTWGYNFIIYGSKTDRSGVISNYGFLSFLFKGGSSNKDESTLTSTSSSDDISNINAEIVIPLLGDETSTEMLVEMASSINDKSKINYNQFV